MHIDKLKTGKLGTFFCLYIAQSIPMSFFSTALPVMMRQENFSLTTIGLLQLIKLPWILKFLWSTFIDRRMETVHDYKRWIISAELVYAALIFIISFLDFKADFYFILPLIILAFIASATQDIATDALAVLSFSRNDKSLVNSMQSMGSFGGTLLGSGVLLLLLHKIGWSDMLPFLALFVFIALLPLVLNRRMQIHRDTQSERAKRADMFYFFTRKGIYKQVGFLFLCYSGLIGILAMLKPYLVDLGYDMKQIGVMNGMAGTFVGFLAAFAGGFIVRRLGRFRSRLLFAGNIIVTTAWFLVLSFIRPETWMLYTGIFLLWGSYGMATIIVYTTAMDCVRPGREGTDFTVQTVITHLSSMIIAIGSGKLADHLGYRGLFIFELSLALLTFCYIIFAFKNDKREENNLPAGEI